MTPPAPSPASALTDELKQTLSARYGEWEASIDEFELFLRRVLQGGKASLEQVHVDDLFLAFACERGNRRALDHFEREQMSALRGALLRQSRGREGLVDDCLQLVRQRLFVASNGSPARIGEYGGRGTLQRWLRVVATRLLLNLHRDEPAPTSGDAEAEWLSKPGADLELDYIHARYRPSFQRAFQQALHTLSARQRSLLRFQLLEGLTIDQLGPLYGVSRATAARWIAEARQQLLEHTRAAIAKELEVSGNELEGMMSLLGAHLELSITGFLRKADPD